MTAQIRQFAVPTDAAGVTVTDQKSVDLVKRYARVRFDGVEVGESAAVGSAEQTPAIIERQRQVALLLQCAEIVGILDAVLTMTNQWLFDRHSFGRPLASYQALKHRAADMKMWFEAARATTAGAVAAVAERSPEAPKLVSVAKAYVAERAPVMLQDCVQLHGGIGVTWEHDLHLYLRRVALYRADVRLTRRPPSRGVRAEPQDPRSRGGWGMTDTVSTPATTESVEEFALRARAWLAENMPSIDPEDPPFAVRAEAESWERAKELQKRLYEGGFAGICFPREYGGLGLDYAYQKAFNDECTAYEMPLILNTPSFTICGATILDMGSEKQKRERISAAIRGDEVLCQLLSEPSGGSDLAGVITRAELKGDTWIINGAKTWSTSAFAADYGLMLARTDWTVPKHEGLSMFLVPLNAPGITMRRITEVNGNEEFCEEFFDNPGASRGMPWWVRSTTAGPSPRASCTTNVAPSAAARSSPAGPGPRTRTRCRRTTSGWPRPPGRVTTPGSRIWRAAPWCAASSRNSSSITSATPSATDRCRRTRAP